MLIAIADDLTGAAEIAGVGLSRGLKGLISTTPDIHSDNDLWCIATDTRSGTQQEAGQLINSFTAALQGLHPSLFYKKVDSVLRGNVMLECEAFTQAQGLDRAIIIPANPSLHRTIKDGTYFIDGVPLAETNFFRSKKQSSHLLDLINPAYRSRTKVIRELSEMDGPGFYFGEVEEYADLLKWAALADEKVALCGGSDFFDALLQYRSYPRMERREAELSFGKRQLFVLGSAALDHDFLLKQISARGYTISNMPWPIFSNSDFAEQDIAHWMQEIMKAYEDTNKMVITMNYRDLPYEERPHLKVALGELIYALIKQLPIDELFVEGGATSYAILKKMQAEQLQPLQDLARGVTRMEMAGYEPLKLTVKPGSYKWPDTIWSKLKNMILD